MLIDTHAHMWWPSFMNPTKGEDGLDSVLQRAKRAGVEKIIAPGTDLETSRQAIELAKRYPGLIYAAVGMHPEETTTKSYSFDKSGFEKLIKVNLSRVVAIGEIGIDLFTEEVQQTLPQQQSLFKAQLELASQFELPVIIHTRNSFKEAWEVLKTLPQMPKGQFHCFSVDEEALRLVVEAGFYVSFAGNITWSKRVGRMVALVPNNRLLLETDSPLMVPRDAQGAPIKGTERNEPANVAYLANKLAELRGQTAKEIEQSTTDNAKTLYKL
jgi:TatD DNase family protein